MAPKRIILHVDMDAFFASVEQHDNPALQGRPVVVGAPPDKRGVVSAASYEARKYGVHSAMPSRTAAKLCPEAVFLPVDMERYKAVSKTVIRIFLDFTPLVEPLSIDEAFLDVSGSRKLFGTGPEIAYQIKARIRKETGLTGSVGVAPNKFLAKLASDLEKPDGLTVVPADLAGIRQFLAPLPVGKLWGVGKATREILNKGGVHTVADLQAAHADRLASLVGEHAATHLRKLAYGEDDREVEIEHEEKSVSREYTFPEDCADRERVHAILLELADKVGRSLRASGLTARNARLKMRWKDFTTITRQRPIKPPANDNDSLREMATALFEAEEMKQPVRLVGFGTSRFSKRSAEQLSLFDSKAAIIEKRKRLSQAIDRIAEHYGEDSIRRGGGEMGDG